MFIFNLVVTALLGNVTVVELLQKSTVPGNVGVQHGPDTVLCSYGVLAISC